MRSFQPSRSQTLPNQCSGAKCQFCTLRQERAKLVLGKHYQFCTKSEILQKFAKENDTNLKKKEKGSRTDESIEH